MPYINIIMLHHFLVNTHNLKLCLMYLSLPTDEYLGKAGTLMFGHCLKLLAR